MINAAESTPTEALAGVLSRVPSTLMDPTDLAVDVLATMRVTRLMREDDITAPLRDWVADRSELGYPIAGWVDRMLACPWCASVWAAAAVQAARQIHPAIPRMFAAAQVTGLLAARR